jgi:hypothetical protein
MAFILRYPALHDVTNPNRAEHCRCDFCSTDRTHVRGSAQTTPATTHVKRSVACFLERHVPVETAHTQARRINLMDDMRMRADQQPREGLLGGPCRRWAEVD